jgi:hypothetical protein
MSKDKDPTDVKSDPELLELMHRYKRGEVNLNDATMQMHSLTNLPKIACETLLQALTRKNIVQLPTERPHKK